MAIKTAIKFLLCLALLGGTSLPRPLLASAPASLRWKVTRIQIGVSSSLFREGSNIIRGSDIDGAIRRSIETWEKAANVDFVLVPSEKQNVSPSGPSGDGISVIANAGSAENVQLFTNDNERAAATTRVFYNARGYITEADIVLNPYQEFSTDGTLGTFDLQSAITHELGHLLGLEHSSIPGATMHERYAKNGDYGRPNFSARTLSASDVAAVRALYGPRDDAGCCTQAVGRVLFTSGKAAKKASVWLEDDGGEVIAETTAGADGSFRFAGINSGKYKVFAQSDTAKFSFPSQQIGDLAADGGDAAVTTKRVAPAESSISLKYLGLNGQLSNMSVPLEAGRTITLLLGGQWRDPESLSVGFNSPHLSVVPGSFRTLDYDGASVVSVDVRVDRLAPKGDYSVSVISGSERSTIVGAVTVEDARAMPIGPNIFEE